MIMSIKVLRYSKKIGFILAGVLIGVCSGISSVSAAEELGSSRARAGFNRPNFNRPNFNRPNFNRPAFNRPNVRPIVGQRPFVRPIEVNPVFVEEEEVNVVDPCFVPEVALFIGPECNVVVNAEED
jgi:hypothetical protein